MAEGYRVHVYVPFGREWFPYFMRWLGERPADMGSVLKALARKWWHENATRSTRPVSA